MDGCFCFKRYNVVDKKVETKSGNYGLLLNQVL